MIQLRLVVPPELSTGVVARLRATPTVFAIVVVPGAARRPQGDLVECMVVREDASVVVEELRSLGLEESGSISLHPVETALSEVARRAAGAATGSPADAVVWETVEARTSETTELSFSFLAFMVLATLIAGVGILTDSLLLIIGAMIVGPEFGPLAGFCVAAVHRRTELARRSLTALVIGFPLGAMASFVGTLALRAGDHAPGELSASTHPATLFISEPNVYSAIVAALAGIAGILSLSTAKSGALIGVLISVTTIPAAANVGVAAAYAEWNEVGGAAAQLGVNLVFIVVAGIATLAIQRWFYARRRERHEDVRARRRTIQL